jgi:uncharacterized protein (DUF433 family)
MLELLNRVSADPNVCLGKPCVRGTRIPISLILEMLARGMKEREIVFMFPQLAHEDILAAIAYGAEATREQVVPVSAEQAASRPGIGAM